MDLTIQPGQIHYIHEINRGETSKSVRVVGSLVRFDAQANEAIIEHKGETLTVDTALIPDFEFRPDSLFTFIGEVESGERGGKRLRARVCRNVDGLSMDLFAKALDVRRAFLADPAYMAQPPA